MMKRTLIGLSSGTTLDGIDAVLLEVEGAGLDMRMNLLRTLHVPYARDVRELLQQIGTAAGACTRKVGILHRVLGEAFAQAAIRVADQASFSLQNVLCIGCPGQLIWHEPEGSIPGTLSLGAASVVAERTGITTASDFRIRDVVLGGTGVPVTSLVDYLLFRGQNESRLLIHLGGISSLVFLPGNNSTRDMIAFQAGPCNIFLNSLMARLTGGREQYDPWGKHAVQGRCIDHLLEKWLSHPIFMQRPPKNWPQREFGEEMIAQTVAHAHQERWSVHDILCTANHFVAECITRAIDRFIPSTVQRMILSGGGTHNGLLRNLLEQHLKGIPMQDTTEFGVPIYARNAVGYAGLAAFLLDGVPANLMWITGAQGSRLLGSLTPGSTANWARCIVWMANQTGVLAAA